MYKLFVNGQMNGIDMNATLINLEDYHVHLKDEEKANFTLLEANNINVLHQLNNIQVGKKKQLY